MSDAAPVGLKPLPRSRPRSRGAPAVETATPSVLGDSVQQDGRVTVSASSGAVNVGAGGLPSAVGSNVTAMMSSMMNGNGGVGGMDPAALHTFMEQRRRQLAASPLAHQAMADPGKLAQVLESNPAARAIMQSNPRLHQLLASPDAMRGLLQGNAQQFAGVLGQDVEQHMDTVARLSAYSQQLRSERAGSGASVHAQNDLSSEAALDSFGSGSAEPAMRNGDAASGYAFPAHTSAHAAAPSQQTAAGSSAAGPAAERWQGHRQAVSAEIQPAPQLPMSWMPAAADSTPKAAAGGYGGTGSRWSTGMAASPRQNGHTWQHEQAPGQPQAKPTIPHADALYPVVFILAVSGLCQFVGRLLPFWLLLVLLFPSFVGGMHLVVLKGGGVDPRRLPATRFTCSLVATLEVLSFIVFAVVVIPRLPHHRIGNIFAICLGSLAFVQHYRAATTDPGYLAVLSDPEVAEARGPRFNMGRCVTCHIVRPLRSKHCDYCQRCVLGADHHCPVINSCVGQGNARVFLAYCMTLLPAQLLFLRGMAAFCRAAMQAPDLGFFAALWRGSVLHPVIVLLAFAQVPSVLLNGLLIARALVCAAANLTTNELMRPSRFGYLADTRDDTFLNPFDRGPAANCLQFWRASRPPDWGSAYGDLMQAGPDALARQVPRFSVTAAVRSAQLANRHLAESRARRRRQREDYILLQAGVRPETLAKAKDTGATGPAIGCTSCAHHQHGHQHARSHQPHELQGHLTAAAAPGSSLSAEPFS